MRRGVALLVTLIMLSALSLLLVKSYDVNSKFSNDEKELRLIYQANKISLDSKPLLKNVLKDVNSSEAFDFIFSKPFPVMGKNFNLVFQFYPVQNSININSIISGKTINKEVYDIIENILISYNVSDTDFFLKLLIDTIDSDSEERVYGSEIVVDDKFFTNSKIYSKKHLKKIMDYYYTSRDDKNIYKIPWDRYINFDTNEIDINFASLELIKLLLPNTNISNLFKEKYYEKFSDLNIDKDRENILKKLKVQFDTNKVGVNILYDNFDKKIELDFIYDIKKADISNIKYKF
jgi:hypothetical protein